MVDNDHISKCARGVKIYLLGSRDPLLEFRDPLISLERLKLETSKLAQRWIAVSTNKKMQNWVKRGHVVVT